MTDTDRAVATYFGVIVIVLALVIWAAAVTP